MKRFTILFSAMVPICGMFTAQPPRFHFKKNDPIIYTLTVGNVKM